MTTPLRQINSIATAVAAAVVLVMLGRSAAAELPEAAEPQTALAKLRETPLPIGVTGTIFAVDPANGKYLVFGREKQVYEYDVASDT